MFIEAKLCDEVNEAKHKDKYTFIDSLGNHYIIKYRYIFGEPYNFCKALLRKSNILNDYVALIK